MKILLFAEYFACQMYENLPVWITLVVVDCDS